MAQQILSDYLAEIARIRATRAGTGEISYYGALTGALNAAGERLKPRVFCVPNLRNRGSGFPDMGLFVAARGMTLEAWPEARAPERGVVEVDDIPADLSVKAGSAQVRRYLADYGLVLVTNYRDFVLLGRDARGQPERRESFSFDCADAAAFFILARGTRRPPGLAARFAEFLERVLLHQAPLATLSVRWAPFRRHPLPVRPAWRRSACLWRLPPTPTPATGRSRGRFRNQQWP